MRRFLRDFLVRAALISVLGAWSAGSTFAGCDHPETALPVSRIVEIDASNGPMFGTVTHQVHEPSFLKPKEVVLTFDDGPMPWVTASILNTLDTFCTKATFFSVGRMALSYPATVKDILARGHTLGSHTYSHPFNMPRMKGDAARSEIERGLAAVATAAGQPIAPFFRFTGLADSARLLRYLQFRHIATFTVDVVSNDSYIHDPEKLADRTMAEVRRQHGGIILFHDIKTATAKALPSILTRLKAEGYSVVHVTARQPAEPLAAEMQAIAPKLAHRSGDSPPAQPFSSGVVTSIMTSETAAVGATRGTSTNAASVTSVSSPLRLRTVKADEADLKVPVKAKLAKRTAPGERITPDDQGANDNNVWLTNSVEEATGPPVIVVPQEPLEQDDATTSGWITDVKTRVVTKPASHTKP